MTNSRIDTHLGQLLYHWDSFCSEEAAASLPMLKMQARCLFEQSGHYKLLRNFSVRKQPDCSLGCLCTAGCTCTTRARFWTWVYCLHTRDQRCFFRTVVKGVLIFLLPRGAKLNSANSICAALLIGSRAVQTSVPWSDIDVITCQHSCTTLDQATEASRTWIFGQGGGRIYPVHRNTGCSAPYNKSATLTVCNLHPEVQAQDLFSIFNAAAPVSSVEVRYNDQTLMGLGFVEFHSIDDADRVIKSMNYTTIKGRMCCLMQRPVIVRIDEDGQTSCHIHGDTSYICGDFSHAPVLVRAALPRSIPRESGSRASAIDMVCYDRAEDLAISVRRNANMLAAAKRYPLLVPLARALKIVCPKHMHHSRHRGLALRVPYGHSLVDTFGFTGVFKFAIVFQFLKQLQPDNDDGQMDTAHKQYLGHAFRKLIQYMATREPKFYTRLPDPAHSPFGSKTPCYLNSTLCVQQIEGIVLPSFKMMHHKLNVQHMGGFMDSVDDAFWALVRRPGPISTESLKSFANVVHKAVCAVELRASSAVFKPTS